MSLAARKSLRTQTAWAVSGGRAHCWFVNGRLTLYTAQCPAENCNGDRAYFFQLQIRSADEPMTTFLKVCFHFFFFFWNPVAYNV